MARLGHSIRILRQARGLTAATVASKADISPAYLSLIESDERIPPQQTLDKIAAALQVEVALLIALLPANIIPSRSEHVKSLIASLRRLSDAETDLRRKLG